MISKIAVRINIGRNRTPQLFESFAAGVKDSVIGWGCAVISQVEDQLFPSSVKADGGVRSTGLVSGPVQAILGDSKEGQFDLAR